MGTTKHSADRRISRTDAALQNALQVLIQKQDYESITINDICEAANVGRSTFYAHYRSKDDLKRGGLAHLSDLLTHRQAQAMSSIDARDGYRFGFGLALFEHARDHRHLYLALSGGRGAAVALGSIRKMLVELVERELGQSMPHAGDAPRAAVIHYIVGAYMAILTWWLDSGAKLPPQQLDAFVRRMTLDGLGSLAAGGVLNGSDAG